MKYLLLLLLSISSYASVLPSEFGSEVSVVADGRFEIKEKKFFKSATYLDLVTTKILKDKAQLSASAVLGSADKHVSASFFYKISPYFSIGASSYSSVNFEFDGEVTVLGRFPYKDFFFMPFITVSGLKEKDGKLGRFGVKTYYKDIGSVVASILFPENRAYGGRDNKDVVYFSVGFSIPIHNVKVLDFLFD